MYSLNTKSARGGWGFILTPAIQDVPDSKDCAVDRSCGNSPVVPDAPVSDDQSSNGVRGEDRTPQPTQQTVPGASVLVVTIPSHILDEARFELADPTL